MRKRIAVLVAQLDETTQHRFLIEFIREAYALDCDVCIFSMYQKFQDTYLRNIGDSNIYELINYELFDAVLVVLDSILIPGLDILLQEQIRERFDGPVLIVDRESPYFDSVMIDHYTPVKKLINHLIEEHGYTEIAFLGGKEGHPHSVQRLNAFYDSMREHGLPVREEWVHHGNYWYDGGAAFADMLLEDAEHLPQALACANDFMAIGAATRLTERGIRIPKDIALIGYDSSEEGRHSPRPLTSANIPIDECGAYSVRWLYAKMMGEEVPAFEPKAPLFFGNSCGCHYELELVPKQLRTTWQTRNVKWGLFSDFNHMLEDMLSQKNLEEFFDTIHKYTHQVEPFYSFDICMNDTFQNPDHLIGERAIKKGYSDNVYHVLSCGAGASESGTIRLDRMFSVKELFPALWVEREYPTTYVFNPLYFDDHCFGYTVLNFKDEVYLYDRRFRIWMRDLMLGMESFYRQQYLQTLIDQIKEEQVRDTMTGLYNYEGFLRQAVHARGEVQSGDGQIHIISIDIRGVRTLNELYNRDYGERAIYAVARFIQQLMEEDELCCRLCNDEFLVALFQKTTERAELIVRALKSLVREYRFGNSSESLLDIHYAIRSGTPDDKGGLEALINHTVSVKNHKKAGGGAESKKEDVEHEIRTNQLVANVLSRNLLTYHYQPIVSAKDGSIFAYEALMRCELESINPMQIIRSATYLNRLADVERATLLNVTEDVTGNLEAFKERKVFINSLPGVGLSEEEDELFSSRVRENWGRFVIEFTEASELSDEQLARLKRKYALLGNEIALDDYGSGYSNVNNLLRYMPQYVKIDRQLISDIEDNPQKQHFVREIIEFSHKNQIVALAEGVETAEELRMCINLGVDLIQGYYTGKPMREPLSELPEDIRGEIIRYHQESKDWKIRYY